MFGRDGLNTQLKEKAAARSCEHENTKAGGPQRPCRLRKQLPAPVFGQIKQGHGFRQFLLRGLEKVKSEWGFVCLSHNLLKLAQRQTPPIAVPAVG